MTSAAPAAPLRAFALPVAPLAPDPFVPVVSTPLKAMTVMEPATFFDTVAVTVATVSTAGANARQISASPR